MRRSKGSIPLLDEIIASLVKNFGFEVVTNSVRKLSTEKNRIGESRPESEKVYSSNVRGAGVMDILTKIRILEPDKYQVLVEFYDRLKSRTVLAESQDIRHFAQLVGLKHIDGRSRRDMLPILIRSLVETNLDLLITNIAQAGAISEEERKKGFSILTDKLVSKD